MSRIAMRLGAVLLVVLFAFGAFAGEGRIPIYQYPTTITASGKYVVTRNLGPAPAGSIIIDVQASDVDIDLNGFALTFASPTGIAVQVMNQTAVVIRNGAIRAGKVFVVDSKKIVLENVLIDDCTEDAVFFDNVTNFTIRGVHVVGAGQAGIRIDNSNGNFSEGLIERNQVENCSDGIKVQLGGSIEILHNRVDRTGAGYAIYVRDSHACLLAENTIYSSALDGIRLENSRCCKLLDNVVHDVSGAGIALEATDDTLLLSNVVSEANSDGIYINGARNQVDRNLSGSNFGFGLHFGQMAVDCTYGRNTSRGDAGGPCPTGGTTDFCDEGANDTSFGDNFMPTLM